jgi:hypothetical protein
VKHSAASGRRHRAYHFAAGQAGETMVIHGIGFGACE